MNEELDTTSTVQKNEGFVGNALYWVLLSGNRLVVAGGMVLIAFVVFSSLVRADLITVEPGSTASTVFGSGLVSGTLTLTTIALSINQLIMSRVFGSPGELFDRLSGSRKLREQVRLCAGTDAVPNNPSEFLAIIGTSIQTHATRFGSAIEESGWSPPDEVRAYAREMAAYGENIESNIESDARILDVLGVIVGSGYAQNMTATELLANRYESEFTPEMSAAIDSLEDLLEAIAVTRQFFKTIMLQQDFARLSRIVAYTGFLSLLVSISLALVYRPNAVTLDPSHLWLVVSVAVAVILVPLAVFISYILRAATIAHRTVSVGQFVPPRERIGGK